jgi:hypothetical protein
LRRACLKFRSLMIVITKEGEVQSDDGVEPVNAIEVFSQITLASVCNLIFRSKFITECNLLPVHGHWQVV